MFGLKIHIKGPTPRRIRKHLARIKKNAWEHIAAWWHRALLPKHFTRTAAARYRYRARSHGYNKRKKRLWGQVQPLVYTGISQRLSAVRDIRANSKRVRVVMQTRTLNRRPRGWPHTMAEELRRVVPSEARDFGRRLAVRLQQNIGKIKGYKKLRVTA